MRLLIPAVLALLAPLAQPQASTPGPGPAAPAPAPEDHELEFEKRFDLAGDDVDELWKVYRYCDSYDLKRSGKKVLRKIIKLDPDHAEAREASGHVAYDGEWFTSEKKLEAYKKQKLEEEAKAKGWVKHEGEWVDPDDIPKLEAGMVRDEDGRWIDRETYEKLQAGYVRHDLDWISPEEVAQADAGLFKCGDEWKELEDADRWHSLPTRPWRIASGSDRFHVHTTVKRALAEQALDEAESTVGDLVRIFGRTPERPATFMLLRSSGQYNAFAAGDPAFRVPQTELRGWSSIHGAYFGEVWFHGGPGEVGGGVGYWDEDDKAAAPFGPFYTRHAAALSFIEGLDPSPKAMAKLRKTGELDVEAFLEEKALPGWLRYGAATYVERYRLDRTPNADATALRKWSVSNIARTGSVDSVRRILDLPLSAEDLSGSAKLLNEAGLVVAFMLDGEDEGIRAKHAAFKAAFQAGESFERQLADLEKALAASDAALKAFADL